MKKGDIILFICIITASIALIAGFFMFSKSGETVLIKQGNDIYGKYPLDKDTEIVLEHNTIAIKDGTAYVSNADCPDKICYKHVPINRRGETIICLPNKVVVEIR